MSSCPPLDRRLSTEDVRGQKVLLVSHGSRGDCQPFVALSWGLKQAGFEVVVFSNPDHEKLATDLGVGFESNNLPFKEFFVSDKTAKANTKNDFIAFLDGLGAHNLEYGPRQYTAYYKTLQSFKPDLVIVGTQHWPDAIWVPIVCRIPTLFINLSNAHTLDPYKAPFGLPSLPFGMNGVVWKLVIGKWADGLKKGYGKTLADLSGKPMGDFFPTRDDVLGLFGGLKPDKFEFLPYIIAQDDNFVGTKPTDLPRFKYVGNLTLPGEACKGAEFGGSAASALDRFIAACPAPPVYIGWGSLKAVSEKFMTLMAVRTIKLTGRRGIVLGGWSGLNEGLLDGEPDTEDLKAFVKTDVFFIDTAAHEVLFPQCSVIVHHGGIGTTIAGVRSGRPTVVTPIFYDQFESAELVEKCGQGVSTKALPTLAPQDIADAIKICLTDATKIKRAQVLGEKMRERDGVKEATDVIISFIRNDIKTGLYWQQFDKFAAQKKKNNSSVFARFGQVCCSVCSK